MAARQGAAAHRARIAANLNVNAAIRGPSAGDRSAALARGASRDSVEKVESF